MEKKTLGEEKRKIRKSICSPSTVITLLVSQDHVGRIRSSCPQCLYTGACSVNSSHTVVMLQGKGSDRNTAREYCRADSALALVQLRIELFIFFCFPCSSILFCFAYFKILSFCFSSYGFQFSRSLSVGKVSLDILVQLGCNFIVIFLAVYFCTGGK